MFSQTQKQKLKEEYLNGKTLMQLSLLFGGTQPTIARELEKQGVKRRQKGKSIDMNKAQKIYCRYLNGEIQKRLAFENEVTEMTIRNWLKHVNPNYKTERRKRNGLLQAERKLKKDVIKMIELTGV